MALIIDDQKHHPEDVTVRANMLELMNKALFYAKPTLTGLTILENAWKLNDMPLYREAFRFCTLGRSIPKELPKLLSSLVAQSTTQQVMNWSEWSEQPISFIFSLSLRGVFSLTLRYPRQSRWPLRLFFRRSPHLRRSQGY